MDLFWICFGSLSCNSEGQMRHWPNSLHLDCNYCHVQSEAFSQWNDGILHHNPGLNLVPLRFIGTSNAFSQDCGHPAFVVPRLLPWIWWPCFFCWQCGEPWWTWKTSSFTSPRNWRAELVWQLLPLAVTMCNHMMCSIFDVKAATCHARTCAVMLGIILAGFIMHMFVDHCVSQNVNVMQAFAW